MNSSNFDGKEIVGKISLHRSGNSVAAVILAEVCEKFGYDIGSEFIQCVSTDGVVSLFPKRKVILPSEN